jgi:hypothetical protein
MTLPCQLHSGINLRHGVSGMASRLPGLLAPIIASLLILGVVGAELPELLLLVDNTSNDFVLQKTGRGGGTPRLAVTTNVILPLNTNCFGRCSFHCDAADIFRTALISSEIFLLHSALRL